jgi:antitoxin YefM
MRVTGSTVPVGIGRALNVQPFRHRCGRECCACPIGLECESSDDCARVDVCRQGGGRQPALTVVILLTMSTPMSLADVKAHLSELVSRVHGQHERVTVTVHGRPSAVLVSVEDLESLEETIAFLADGDAVAALIASEAEVARGEIVSQAQLLDAMAKRRRSVT